MDEQGVTIYGLARLLDPDNPDSAERNIYRWLSPESTTIPTLQSRIALALALGRDPDFFDPRIGVAEALKIARIHALAELREEIVLRHVWAPEGGPLGGYFLTREQRELIS